MTAAGEWQFIRRDLDNQASAWTISLTSYSNLYTPLLFTASSGKGATDILGQQSHKFHMGQRLSICSDIHGLDLHVQVTQVCFCTAAAAALDEERKRSPRLPYPRGMSTLHRPGKGTVCVCAVAPSECGKPLWPDEVLPPESLLLVASPSPDDLNPL